jgi:hypothetical protein
MTLVFAEKPSAHGIIHRQFRAAENVIGNARGILGDQWHGSFAQCCRLRTGILKQSTEPSLHGAASTTPTALFFGVVVCGNSPIGICGELVP